MVDKAPDLRADERPKGWMQRLGRGPERAEGEREMRRMKEASSGEDGVRLCYLLIAAQRQ